MTESASALAPDGRAVANILLDMAAKDGRELTIMQLLKVLFFAHAMHLVLHDEPLIADRAQAWQFGPVFPRVYRAFSKAGSLPVRTRAADKATGEVFTTSLPTSAMQVLRVALAQFGGMSAFRLSDITHAPGSPWAVTMAQHGRFAEIPNEMIKAFYTRPVPPPAA